MSVLFQTVLNTGKYYMLNKSLRASVPLCNCLYVRKYSVAPNKFITFDEVVAQRRSEARRSLVVQVNSESSFDELYRYCSKYADIDGIHHYRNAGGEHFMLIEFNTEDSLKAILKDCSSHQNDAEVMASQSPFLWFRAAGKKEKLVTPHNKTLLTRDGNTQISEESLIEHLAKCSTVSQQIEVLFDQTKLNDVGVRLRFMVARHLEILFQSLYANVELKPFGSSVNGFGKMGCDLDLVLTNVVTNEMSSPSKRLVYQEKRCGGGRGAWQRQLELVAELLETRAAGIARVQRILHARVPIVKFTHDLAGVECDLCFHNVSGIHMSELLWLLGELGAPNPVRPLAMTVRRWAAAAGLTSAHPGRWITNFPLTLLVIFFLQQPIAGKMLPPFKELVNRAEKKDVRVAEDNMNCTFLRDMNKLPADCYGQGKADLQTLLLQFFEFYAQFDFTEKAISINEGVPIRKPNSLPLYIVNPLDQTQNVSRNVSYEECQRLQLEVRNAAWQLESVLEGPQTEDWGLLGLIENKSSKNLKRIIRAGNSHRLVSVKDLFKDGEDEETEGFKSKLQKFSKSNAEVEESVRAMKAEFRNKRDRDSSASKDTMKFKNRQVASEVYRIRRDKVL